MRKDPKLGLAVSLLLAGSVWFYVQHVLIGHQQADAALHGIPRGNLCDLYPRWLGARELLLHRRNPYSSEITREIQVGYYGRPLDAQRPDDPRDQMAFAYPLYVVFLLAPTITLPFPLVRLAAHWLFTLLTAASVLLWIRVLRWRVSPSLTAILVVLTLGSFPVVQGIKLEQLTLLVGGMIAVCCFLLVRNHLLLAGVLLALATIKPQLVLLIAAWFVLWACGDLRERGRFLLGFGLTLAALFAGAEFLMPGWLRQFVGALAAYRRYTGESGSILAVVMTPSLGLLLSALMLLVLAVIGWRARRVRADNPLFALVSSLVLAVTVVVIPMISLYNQILLLPAVMMLVRDGGFLWKKDRLTRLACIVSVVLMMWPWLAAFLISLASLFVSPESLGKAWTAPLWTGLTLPIAVLMLLARLATLTMPRSVTEAVPMAGPVKLPET